MSQQLYLDLMMQLVGMSAESADVGYLHTRTLELISKANGWVLGQYWKINEEDASCTDWFYSSAVFSEFRKASMERKFSKGVGIVGRVWGSGLPVTIPDVEAEITINFTRKKVAIKSGIKAAFAFPAKNGPFISGVYEFFSLEPIRQNDEADRFYEKLGIYLATLVAEKQAEVHLRLSEALNSIVLNNARNAFVSMNASGQISFWSEKAERLFGWSADEAVGQQLGDLIIPERFRDAHNRGLIHYLSNRKPTVLNKTVRAPALHREGREIPVELHIFPMEAYGRLRFGAFIVDCTAEPKKPDLILE